MKATKLSDLKLYGNKVGGGGGKGGKERGFSLQKHILKGF
jgi:hypothetical protein